MSKIQRRNNQACVNHVADLLPTGRELAPNEPVRCDLPPTQPPEPQFGVYKPSTHTAVSRLVTGRPIREMRAPGRPPANRIDLAKLAFDRKMADALRHGSDSEGGHAD